MYSRLLKVLSVTAWIVLVIGCSGHPSDRPDRPLQPGDSLYSIDAVLSVYGKDPEHALAILDSGLMLGNIGDDDATLLKARIYAQSGTMNELDTASLMLEGLMKSDFVVNSPNHREMVLDLLVNVSRMRHDHEHYLLWADEKASFCREQGLEVEALRTDAEIGAALAVIGDEERGLGKISGVIANLDRHRLFDQMDACIIAMKRKINILRGLGQHEAVIPLAHRIIEKIDDFSRHPDVYADQSYRFPPDDAHRDDYCRYYTSQAYGFLAASHASLDHADSVRHYLRLFEDSDYGRSMNGGSMVVSAWCYLGQFDKVLDYCNQVEHRLAGDTLRSDYAIVFRCRALAAEEAGHFREAIQYRKRYEDLIVKIERNLRKSQAYHYAFRYNLHQEQASTALARRKAENNRNMAIAGVLLALVASAFSIRFSVLQRSLKRKNRALVEQISEATRLKMMGEKQESSLGTIQEQPASITSGNPDEMNDEELFDYISWHIRTEQLYLDPMLGRQTLIDKLKISKGRIGAAFSQGSRYRSLPDYVRNLRLEYACSLLTEHPEMSIADVSAASGFSSPAVFSRDFKQKYEVAPSLFRRRETNT